MGNNQGNDFYQNFFAVLAGVLSAIASGFLIKVVFGRLFHFDPFNEFSTNESNLKILLSIAAWLFFSSLVGGMVCALIAGRNDLGHIIINSLVVLTLYFLIGGTEIFNGRSILSWSVILAIPLGIFIGEWVGSSKRSEE